MPQIRANIGAILAAAALAVLAIACTVQTIRISGLHLNLKAGTFSLPFLNVEGWKETATKAQAALKDVAAAQPKAAAAQAAANHEPAAITGAIARQSDDRTPAYLAQVAAAAALHAGPAGGMCAKAPEGVAQRADLPGTVAPAPRHDDEAGSADMVSVARADWQKFIRAAGQLAELYQVGQAWIAQGAGTPEPDSASTEADSSAP